MPAPVRDPVWTGTPFGDFTEQEHVVARLLCTGATNREIAKELCISIKTVDTHRTHVMNKSKARNNVHLYQLALAHGYVAPPARISPPELERNP